MDRILTEEQKMIKDLCRQIARDKIRPVAAEHDEKEEFPWPTVKVLAEADIFGIYIPEEFGGMGGGVFDLAIATEELSWGCGGISLAFAATALGTFPIILFG
ncbi:MAG: acyl-CoA dehydrogenase family protein, partial [Candidatus Omnitrophota bacterium]